MWKKWDLDIQNYPRPWIFTRICLRMRTVRSRTNWRRITLSQNKIFAKFSPNGKKEKRNVEIPTFLWRRTRDSNRYPIRKCVLFCIVLLTENVEIPMFSVISHFLLVVLYCFVIKIFSPKVSPKSTAKEVTRSEPRSLLAGYFYAIKRGRFRPQQTPPQRRYRWTELEL